MRVPDRAAAAAGWLLLAGCGGGGLEQADTNAMLPNRGPADPPHIERHRSGPPESPIADVFTGIALSLADPDKGARMQVMLEQLDELDPATRAYALSTALLDSDAGVRLEAVDALTRFPDDRGLQLLSRALGDSDVAVREAAIEAIAGFASDQAIDVLSSALADGSASVREDVVYALGSIDRPAAVSALRAALSDPDQTIQDIARAQLLRREPS